MFSFVFTADRWSSAHAAQIGRCCRTHCAPQTCRRCDLGSVVVKDLQNLQNSCASVRTMLQELEYLGDEGSPILSFYCLSICAQPCAPPRSSTRRALAPTLPHPRREGLADIVPQVRRHLPKRLPGKPNVFLARTASPCRASAHQCDFDPRVRCLHLLLFVL